MLATNDKNDQIKIIDTKTMDEQSKRIADLEAQLSSVKAELSLFRRILEPVVEDQFRGEVTRAIGEQDPVAIKNALEIAKQIRKTMQALTRTSEKKPHFINPYVIDTTTYFLAGALRRVFSREEKEKYTQKSIEIVKILLATGANINDDEVLSVLLGRYTQDSLLCELENYEGELLIEQKKRKEFITLLIRYGLDINTKLGGNDLHKESVKELLAQRSCTKLLQFIENVMNELKNWEPIKLKLENLIIPEGQKIPPIIDTIGDYLLELTPACSIPPSVVPSITVAAPTVLPPPPVPRVEEEKKEHNTKTPRPI